MEVSGSKIKARSTYANSGRFRAVVERAHALVGAVDEVVEDDNVARLDLAPQAPGGRGGDHVRAIQHLQRVDVRSIVDVRWRQRVRLAMPRQQNLRK